MIKTFANICKMSQKNLKKYVSKELKKTYSDVTVGDGFVYAQGTFPVLLVAHLDTVHKALPNHIYFDENKDALYSPTGIGGDDRCGVYMIFEVIKKFNCSVLFCEDEESGMIGAGKFTKTDLSKSLEFNYIIEFDRKGSNDAVFYDCDNDEFEKFITKEFYKTAYGSFSDISEVAPALGCAAVNLSCGYYNAHTLDEYVVFSEMEDSIEAACKILERTTESDKFEYVEKESTYDLSKWVQYWKGKNCSSVYGTDGDYNSYYDADYYLIEFTNDRGIIDWFDTYAVSEDEAIGKFLIIHRDLTYNHITDVSCDAYSRY